MESVTMENDKMYPEHADADLARAAENAQSLIRLLHLPPQHHSVFVRTDVNEHGEFVRSYRVAIHPSVKSATVPSEHCGLPVKRIAWGALD